MIIALNPKIQCLKCNQEVQPLIVKNYLKICPNCRHIVYPYNGITYRIISNNQVWVYHEIHNKRLWFFLLSSVLRIIGWVNLDFSEDIDESIHVLIFLLRIPLTNRGLLYSRVDLYLRGLLKSRNNWLLLSCRLYCIDYLIK